MKVTLDTNVLRDSLRKSRPDLQKDALAILKAHRLRKCCVAVTTRVLNDARSSQTSTSQLQIELISLLTEHRIDEIPSVMRLDESGFLDALGDESWREDEKRLLDLIWPGARPSDKKHRARLRDIDHLLGHRLHGGDVFVTRDQPILRKQDALRQRFGIEVISPRDLVERLSGLP